MMEEEGEYSPKIKESSATDEKWRTKHRHRGSDPEVCGLGGKTANWFLIPESTQTRSWATWGALCCRVSLR